MSETHAGTDSNLEIISSLEGSGLFALKELHLSGGTAEETERRETTRLPEALHAPYPPSTPALGQPWWHLQPLELPGDAGSHCGHLRNPQDAELAWDAVPVSSSDYPAQVENKIGIWCPSAFPICP